MQVTIEQTYIKGLKTGSRKAFTSLYNMYSSRLYGFCFQWTKSREDSEEIVQDVFIRLWTHRETIQEEETLLYYIFRIAKNLLINRYRSNLNSPAFEEYVRYNNEMKLSIDNTSCPIEYIEFCQQLKYISHSLPRTQKLIFEYSIHQQMSHREIAEMLKLSEQTVRNQLSLALKAFREKLKKKTDLLIWLFLLLALK